MVDAPDMYLARNLGRMDSRPEDPKEVARAVLDKLGPGLVDDTPFVLAAGSSPALPSVAQHADAILQAFSSIELDFFARGDVGLVGDD